MSTKRLVRETFETSRESEFFSRKELSMQMGHSTSRWALSVLHQLIDNSLDACEASHTDAPSICVNVGDDYFEVIDNGPGIPHGIVESSLNYLTRTSTKSYYVSPTRGQMGNALKTVWAAPFVVSGEGRFSVDSQGVLHTIKVTLDRLTNRPTIVHRTTRSVKTGTTFRVYWENSACSLCSQGFDSSYNSICDPESLLKGFAAFNPHSSFWLDGVEVSAATNPDWHKWRPDSPTSPHWYTVDSLRDLIAAYLVEDRKANRRPRTLRSFVSEFQGLTGTAKQKQLGDTLAVSHLSDFLIGESDISESLVNELLEQMQDLSSPVKPAQIGILGRRHIRYWLMRHCEIIEETFRYRRIEGTDYDGIPYVQEVAFAQTEETFEEECVVYCGLNWTPSLNMPIEAISDALNDAKVDREDPVVVLVHIAKPRFEFIDRGKTRIELS